MKISLPLLFLSVVSRQDSAIEAFLLSKGCACSISVTQCRHRQISQDEGPLGQHTLNMIASTSSSQSYGKDKSNSSKGKKNDDEEHFLLKQFMTASGEIVNPYNVLQVPRTANRADIKGSYKQLAKRYHPDGARNRAILPGKWYVHM
jgi:hypothetical protein